MIRPDNIHAINSTKDIDDVISSLNLVVKSAALQIKLDFHRSLNLAKMPWWSSSMWALRSNLGESHNLPLKITSTLTLNKKPSTRERLDHLRKRVGNPFATIT